MKQTRSFATMAILACAALASATVTRVTDTCRDVFALARAARTWITAHVVGIVEAFAQPELREPAELGAEKAQACAHAMRIAKRERPVHTASWRMCPST